MTLLELQEGVTLTELKEKTEAQFSLGRYQ